jgi:uncharacterized protein
MSIALLSIELLIPGSHSLKDKRRVLQSLFSKIKSNYNVSIAELENQDLWQRSDIGIVSINTSATELNKTLSNIVDYVSNFSNTELINYRIENL